ncbi:TonB-dependent receptor [Pelomonas sp. CA6]|uniref:TonB-dependent receptor n=1 Tax=Pelomonas sp. CA6 TaxID=2907999 RepID=UPI001F4BF641|nr:TonB-dependent receptor [Pelomonas sp. CA6]MCH7343520.1 TonB-dependent receptor [Pelomonas sp. CA6]
MALEEETGIPLLDFLALPPSNNARRRAGKPDESLSCGSVTLVDSSVAQRMIYWYRHAKPNWLSVANRQRRIIMRLKPIASAVAAALAAFTVPAIAQQSGATQLERVEVTGTNIKRVDAETASPIQTISREDIQKSGKTTIADVIMGLNGNSNGSVPMSFSNGFAAGAAGVSLRGLGANSTLVLLNGRRLAPYGLADDGQRTFVDLSTIPLDAVERVEVVKDGASAIYGSDAIAGVVNIITRQDYQGISANVSYGQTRYSDGERVKAAIAGGFGDIGRDRYNVFFTLEAQSIGEVRQSDRQDRKWIGDPDMTKYGYDYLQGGIRGQKISNTSVSPSPTGWARAVTDATGATPVPGSAYLQLKPIEGCATHPSAVAQGYSGCTWNILDYNQLQPKEKKLNFLTRGTLQVSPSVTAFGEVGLFTSKVSTTFTPTSVSASWVDAVKGTNKDNTNIVLGPNHPDNPTPGSYSRLRYVTADFGGRDNTYNTTVSRALAGLKGTAWDWDWETGLLYTESKTKQGTDGYVRDSVLRDFLTGRNDTGLNPSGKYYRLGANAGLNGSDIRGAIAPHIEQTSKTSITALDIRASRELIKLPGGMLALAVGAEFRQEKVDSPPKPFTYDADIIGLGYSGFTGNRRVNAMYAEFVAPVLKSLELNAALRTDRYSDYGSSTTPKLGFTFKPLPQFLLRGTYAEGFRAPGAAESGKSEGGSAGYVQVRDPLRCPMVNGVATPLPGATISDSCEAQVVAFSAANTAVKPEKSKSFNFGVVLEPIKDLSLSLDYWKIKRKDEINGADPATVLENPAGFPSAVILRNAGDALPGVPNSGTIAVISAPYTNGPSSVTDGIDIDLRHRMSLGAWGRLVSGLTWTHIQHFRRTLSDGKPYEYAGTIGPTSMSSSSGQPKDKATFQTTWDRGAFSFTATVNYVSGYKNVEHKYTESGCIKRFANGEEAPLGCRAPSFTTFDLSGKYDVSKALQVYGSISNLFDRVAPLDLQAFYGSTHYNANYNQAGGIGRTFNVGLKYQFR